MLESFVSEGRRQGRDQRIVLAIAVVEQGVERLAGKHLRIGTCRFRNRAKIGGGLAKDAGHDTIAVIAALKCRVGQLHKTPHQVQAFGWIPLGHLVDDSLAVHFEIAGQGPYFSPVDERTRTREGGQPFADFSGNRHRTLPARKFKPEPAFYRGVAFADLDQQFGKPPGAQRLQVLGIQGFLRSHRVKPHVLSANGRSHLVADHSESLQTPV